MNQFTDYLAEQKPFTYLVKVDNAYRLFYRTSSQISEIEIKKIDEFGRAAIVQISDFKMALNFLSRFSEKNHCFCYFANMNIATVIKSQGGGYYAALVLNGVLNVQREFTFSNIHEASRYALSFNGIPCFICNVLMPTNVITVTL